MYASISTEAKTFTLKDISDLAKLPKVGIPGTAGVSDDDNKPILYGSKAILTTGAETVVYILTPDNEWTKM